MIVVSDTSPILNLSAVGKLDLLHGLYSDLAVPPAVQAELSTNSIDLDALWMGVVVAQDRNGVAALREQLDPGEAEAIVVAAEIAAGLLLIDEKRGRRIAIDRGLGSDRPSRSIG